AMKTDASLLPLKQVVADHKEKLALRVEALAALSGSRQGTVWLLAQHEAKTLPDALVADTGRLLRNSPYQDLRNKALLAFPPPGRLDPKNLPDIAKLAQRRGDIN